VTSGGASGTIGGRARLIAFAIFATIGFAFAAVNALSELDERERIGRPLDAWEPWTWELTSFLAFLALAPAVFRLSQRLRPARFGWPATVGLHFAGSVAVSLAHVALMIAMRHAAYLSVGDTYDAPGPLLDMLLYEYRKDLISYAVLALLPHVAERLVEQRRPDAAPAPGRRIEVRDGSRTVLLAPADIEWAQAAGNYVELYGAFGTLLHRQTLAALEEELKPDGFVRVHRSRIVRTAAIRTLETKPSGDFELTLADGTRIGGSRRYRSNVA